MGAFTAGMFVVPIIGSRRSVISVIFSISLELASSARSWARKLGCPKIKMVKCYKVYWVQLHHLENLFMTKTLRTKSKQSRAKHHASARCLAAANVAQAQHSSLFAGARPAIMDLCAGFNDKLLMPLAEWATAIWPVHPSAKAQTGELMSLTLALLAWGMRGWENIRRSTRENMK